MPLKEKKLNKLYNIREMVRKSLKMKYICLCGKEFEEKVRQI